MINATRVMIVMTSLSLCFLFLLPLSFISDVIPSFFCWFLSLFLLFFIWFSFLSLLFLQFLSFLLTITMLLFMITIMENEIIISMIIIMLKAITIVINNINNKNNNYDNNYNCYNCYHNDCSCYWWSWKTTYFEINYVPKFTPQNLRKQEEKCNEIRKRSKIR